MYTEATSSCMSTARTSVAVDSRKRSPTANERDSRRHAHRRRLNAQPSLKCVRRLISRKDHRQPRDAHGTTARPQRAHRWSAERHTLSRTERQLALTARHAQHATFMIHRRHQWLYPFPSERFHVLLNSLFKVLCNFPSRYLFAIGLTVMFSLRWGLPPASSCTPKQPDSPSTTTNAPRTRTGLAPSPVCSPSQGSLGHPTTLDYALFTPHVRATRRRGIRCWAPPVSLAVTQGILVSLFSSA